MTDTLSIEERSKLMSRIHGKDTTIEKKVRAALHKRGFRFRKNVKKLPGTPDIVLAKYKAVVFVHGCFWHGHLGCRKSRLPSTGRDFWKEKRKANIERDDRKVTDLINLGWRVAIIWQCCLEKGKIYSDSISQLESWIKSNKDRCEIPNMCGYSSDYERANRLLLK